MNTHHDHIDDLLTPAEVAAILFVDPKTVTRWARAGKLDSIRTPGGHRRYLRTDVLAIMSGAHHSQQADLRPLPAADQPEPGQRLPVDADVAAAAAAAQALADDLEAKAKEAVEAVVRTAAEMVAVAERAATAASKARSARRLATTQAALTETGRAVRTTTAVQIPSQRQIDAPDA